MPRPPRDGMAARKQYTVRVREQTLEMLRQLAARKGVPMCTFTSDLIDDEVERLIRQGFLDPE